MELWSIGIMEHWNYGENQKTGVSDSLFLNHHSSTPTLQLRFRWCYSLGRWYIVTPGILIPFALAVSMASSYPASACRITPVPESEFP